MFTQVYSSKISRYLKNTGYKFVFGDRRCQFNDFSRIKPKNWQKRISSSIMQFYSSVDNIGNYLPVLGIQQMLDHQTDTWCIHDPKIDFEFINQNYKCVIIGGAGLLHECFENFWTRVLKECQLPILIWGVGVCLPDQNNVRTDLSDSIKNSGVSREIITQIAQRCELINVRDNLTADYYDLKDADISACPTIVYVRKFQHKPTVDPQFLLSSHEELVSLEDQGKIFQAVGSTVDSFRYTDNFQKTYQSIDDIILNYYCPSSAVVTTRLHGAIIAYGLGIPYVAIARDLKMREFHRLHGNGICLEHSEEIEHALIQVLKDEPSNQVQIDSVLAFGRQASECIASFCSLSVAA